MFLASIMTGDQRGSQHSEEDGIFDCFSFKMVGGFFAKVLQDRVIAFNALSFGV